MGRFHLRDWRALGRTSGRPVIPVIRPQEVLTIARNSHDTWMAINRYLRGSRKFIIKFCIINHGKKLDNGSPTIKKNLKRNDI